MKQVTIATIGYGLRGNAGAPFSRRLRARGVGGGAMMILLAIGGAVRGQDCPPETFDYGPSYGGEVEQIVLDHYGTAGPVLPDAQDCARTARDLGVMRATFPELADVGHIPAQFQPNVMFIETSAPSAPELVCTNLYYQVEFEHSWGDWWRVTFPRPVNIFALIAIYMELPTVLDADVSGYACGAASGCCGYTGGWDYSARPNGVWRWTVTEYFPIGPMGHGCGVATHIFYVSESGQVWTASGPQAIEHEASREAASVEGAMNGPVGEVDGASGAATDGSTATGVGGGASYELPAP